MEEKSPTLLPHPELAAGHMTPPHSYQMILRRSG
jgi:hypothetical protein